MQYNDVMLVCITEKLFQCLQTFSLTEGGPGDKTNYELSYMKSTVQSCDSTSEI